MANAPIESPCINICALDEQDVCMGCYRTLQEIADWSLMEEAQREEVLRQCKTRAE